MGARHHEAATQVTGARSNTNGHVGRAGRCDPCGKDSYRTRRDAKIGARHTHGKRGARGREEGQTSHMHPYLCPHNTGMFHIGHLPRDVRNGTLDREEYLDKVAAKRLRQ